MGEQAAWFFVWIPKKEEEKRLIQVEKEKQIEAGKMKLEEELAKEEARLLEEEQLRAKEETERKEKEEEEAKQEGGVGGAEQSVREKHNVEGNVGTVEVSGSDLPAVDAVTDETAKAENLGAGVREGEGSTASVRLIEVQEVSNPSPAPGNNPDAGLLPKELPTVDVPPQVPSSAAPTSIASGLAALTTAQTEGDSPPTPLAEKKLEQVDHEEILTLEEILNKELANLVVAGLTWQTSRDKTTVLAMFYVR